MIRVLAILSFWVTLLCPVYCLAGDDACCADHCCGPEPQNCEAMAVGAIVAPPTIVAAPGDHATPPPGGVGGLVPGPRGDAGRLAPSGRHRAEADPPGASTRRAWLQVFLF